MRSLSRTALAFTVAIMATPALAVTAQLGDPAKPIEIAEWIKGSPVNWDAGKGDTIYVVEFWATWCGPCRTSIPHLTELQAKYKDDNVVFIGVTDEEPGVVRPFVEDMGDQMDYIVAIDKDDATSNAYMRAYNQNGIPTAFVVDKQGRVAWYGHPMGELEDVIDALVEGTYDVEKEKVRMARMQEVREKLGDLQRALMSGQEEQAYSMGRTILKDYADFAPALANAAWVLVNVPDLENPDYGLAVELAQAAIKAEEEEVADLHHILARTQYLKGDYEAAVASQRKAIELARAQGNTDALSFFEETLEEYENPRPHADSGI